MPLAADASRLGLLRHRALASVEGRRFWSRGEASYYTSGPPYERFLRTPQLEDYYYHRQPTRALTPPPDDGSGGSGSSAGSKKAKILPASPSSPSSSSASSSVLPESKIEDTLLATYVALLRGGGGEAFAALVDEATAVARAVLSLDAEEKVDEEAEMEGTMEEEDDDKEAKWERVRLLCEVVHFDALAIATALKLATNASATPPGATSSSKPSSPPSLGGGNNLPMVVLVRLVAAFPDASGVPVDGASSRTAARPFGARGMVLSSCGGCSASPRPSRERRSGLRKRRRRSRRCRLWPLPRCFRTCSGDGARVGSGWSLHCHRVGNTESEVIMSLENGMALLLLRSGGAGEGSVIPTRSSSDGESSRTESELQQFMHRCSDRCSCQECSSSDKKAQGSMASAMKMATNHHPRRRHPPRRIRWYRRALRRRRQTWRRWRRRAPWSFLRRSSRRCETRR